MGTHPNLKIPTRVAIAFMLLRLVFYFLGWEGQAVQMGFLALGLALLIPLCIYVLWPRPYNFSMIEGFVMNMRVLGLYSVIVTVFVYVYYSFIDTGYFPEMRAMILERELSGTPIEEQTKVAENIDLFFSIRNFTVLHLLLFLALSFFYSIFFAAVKRLAYRNSN